MNTQEDIMFIKIEKIKNIWMKTEEKKMKRK